MGEKIKSKGIIEKLDKKIEKDLVGGGKLPTIGFVHYVVKRCYVLKKQIGKEC